MRPLILKLLLAITLALFLAFSASVVSRHGYLGFYDRALDNTATALLFTDLCVSLILITTWMARDARKTGRNLFPYVAITAALGVAGPLLYLLLAGRTKEGTRL